MHPFLFSLLLASAAPAAAGVPLPDSVGAASDSGIVAAPDSARLRVVVATRVSVGPDRLADPAGLAIDSFGRLYVSDASLHRLQRFDRDGTWLGESGTLGSEAGEMRVPGAVVRLGALTMGVLDRENRRVVAFDLFGRRIGVVLDLADPTLEAQVGRVDPGVLAADRGGALYLSDPARERILCFDASGRYLRAVGGYGSRPGQLRGVRGLALTARGELVIAERLNARLQVLDGSGRPVKSWPLPVGRTGAELPVAVDDQGRIAVADQARGRLWLFDTRGRALAAIAGLDRPRALAFGIEGELLIAGREPAAVRALTFEPISRSAPEGR